MPSFSLEIQQRNLLGWNIPSHICLRCRFHQNQRSANQTPARMEAYAMEWMEAVTAWMDGLVPTVKLNRVMLNWCRFYWKKFIYLGPPRLLEVNLAKPSTLKKWHHFLMASTLMQNQRDFAHQIPARMEASAMAMLKVVTAPTDGQVPPVKLQRVNQKLQTWHQGE